MTTTVETRPAEDDDVAMRVTVTTTDAKGVTREYDIHIREEDTIGWEHILHGRRVDDDAPDEPAGGGVTSHAYDAAAERFKAAGYEVHGR